MLKAITVFHQDENNDWVAELECGHNQHVRHNPPWTSRPWTQTAEGRAGKIGELLECLKCDRNEPIDRPIDRPKDRPGDK